jgi:hypothetical protein
MFGNGAKILGMAIIRAHRLMALLGLRVEIQLIVFCVAARGTAVRGIAAQLTASTARRLTVAAITVSV